MKDANSTAHHEWLEECTRTENSNGNEDLRKDKLRLEVTRIILELGIPAHIKGFFYLREAIIFTVNSPEMIIPVTKVLYPIIAGMFDTTGSRVERAIRHAIEVAWNRSDPKNRQEYFGVTVAEFSSHPTNSEFVASIADHIKTRAGVNRLLPFSPAQLNTSGSPCLFRHP